MSEPALVSREPRRLSRWVGRNGWPLSFLILGVLGLLTYAGAVTNAAEESARRYAKQRRGECQRILDGHMARAPQELAPFRMTDFYDEFEDVCRIRFHDRSPEVTDCNYFVRQAEAAPTPEQKAVWERHKYGCETKTFVREY